MSGGALEEAYAGREGGWNLCFLPIRVHIRCQIPLRTHIPDTLSPPFPVRGVVADHGLAVREDRYIAGAQTAQAHEPLTHPILVAANVTNPDKEALADLIGPSLRRCGITRRG